MMNAAKVQKLLSESGPVVDADRGGSLRPLVLQTLNVVPSNKKYEIEKIQH